MALLEMALHQRMCLINLIVGHCISKWLVWVDWERLAQQGLRLSP